jgi:hypothetical protein
MKTPFFVALIGRGRVELEGFGWLLDGRDVLG